MRLRFPIVYDPRRARQDVTVRELTANLHDLERHRWAQEEEIRRLQTEIALQAAEIQDLDRQLTRAQAHLATANADGDRLDHQLDLAAADISDLRSQASGQERELDERGHVAAAATPTVPTTTPPTGPTPSQDQLQAALLWVNEELDLMRTARDTARDQATAAVRDVDQAHQDRDAALRENADLRSCLESAEQVIRAQDAQFLDVQNAYAMLRHTSDRSSEDLKNVADTLSRVARWIGLRQCAPITPGRRSRSRSGSPDSTGHIHKRARSAPPPRSRSQSRSPARSPSPSFSLHGSDEELPAGQEGSDQDGSGSQPRSSQRNQSEEGESSPARSAANEEGSESEGPNQETDEEEDKSEGSVRRRSQP
ncbi:hypothetical protein PHYSODRAFT_329131 [Phytophthora sojae]|uniref:Autophagy-related protein 16 domain-containing protein n=1 Tax=Phytophthora sojae (strain P6497) TaxID=1094619 RepID=G4Z947_PHYSP|nr:hypothetical protein PHYSODRAFT_329131 [Phytophthora sojae]EGZ21101.1 hypothetical protein PHYSODRAFT_329131 [Phytophthora sojae]|eukprot:XP_009523818.1 hypothetical protein PHYSODRAFT_329131 [Phytophthora sojae]